MPNKIKPTWICQHCHRPFTTKYSLMRHFKRFPEHSPPNLNDGSDNLKAITVTLEDGVRTVQAGPSLMPQAPSNSSAYSHPGEAILEAEATTPPEEHTYRRVSTGSTHSVETRAAPIPTTKLPVVEQTPSTASYELDTPTTGDGEVSMETEEQDDYSLLPRFLEEEQILNIATPQQQRLYGTPQKLQLSSSLSTPIGFPQHHMSIADTLHSPLWPGEALLSPLAPACNIGQVFAQENNLRPLAASSPLEMEDLNHTLLLGEDEVTSPLNFLEKTASMTTSLDFLSPPKARHVDVTSTSMDYGMAPLV